jgi:hypothetical protein
MAAPGYVTLIAPSGADQGPVSYGAFGFICYRERGTTGRLLVDVPDYTAHYFCDTGAGFVRADPEPQGS